MFVNLFKKRPRLGRKAMPPARPTVQVIEGCQGFAACAGATPRPLPFQPCECSRRVSLSERLEETLLVAIEIQDVEEMLGAVRGAVKKVAAPSELDVFPPGPVPVFLKPVHQRLEGCDRIGNRVADVRERQRHPALSGEEAVDFHDRDQAREPAVINCSEVKRLVPVGLAQHPRPGRGVEKRGPVGGGGADRPSGGVR